MFTFTLKALEEAIKETKKCGKKKDDVVIVKFNSPTGSFEISVGPIPMDGVTVIDHDGKGFTAHYRLVNEALPF